MSEGPRRRFCWCDGEQRLCRRASRVALVGKNPSASAEDIRDAGSIPGSGRSPGEGICNPLQYSCLGNPIDREAQGATVHKVAKSQARLSNLVLTNTIIRKRQGLCKISYRCGTNPKIGTESRKWVDCEGSFLNLAME